MTTQTEALKLALEALQVATTPLAKDRQEVLRAIAAIKEALAQPEQEPVDFEALIVDIECIDCRYRGDPSYDRDAYWMRDEVIAAIKRHSSYYTTPPQPKEPEQEPVAIVQELMGGFVIPMKLGIGQEPKLKVGDKLYTTPPQRTWVGLTVDEMVELVQKYRDTPVALVDTTEAKLKEKNT